MVTEQQIIREKLEIALAPISNTEERVQVAMAEMMGYHAHLLSKTGASPVAEASVFIQAAAFGIALIPAPTVEDIDKRLERMVEDTERLYAYVKAQTAESDETGMAGG